MQEHYQKAKAAALTNINFVYKQVLELNPLY